MGTRTERRLIDGPAGRIEIALDWPDGAPRSIAYIGHPHPLYGGNLDHKVAATLARAYSAMHWLAVRPNFRGVGATEGVHDDGQGETDDFLHVIDEAPRWLGDTAPTSAALALAGFPSAASSSRASPRGADALRNSCSWEPQPACVIPSRSGCPRHPRRIRRNDHARRGARLGAAAGVAGRCPAGRGSLLPSPPRHTAAFRAAPHSRHVPGSRARIRVIP
jgi:hypothetical protein